MIAALHNTDCLAWLKAQPDAAFNVCITDPPFDERTHAGARTNKRRIDPFTNEIDFAHMDPTVFVPEMLRITKRWIVCFCALEQLAVYQSVAGDAYVRGGVWVKNNAMPQITGDRPAQGVEGVAIMHRPGKKHWNGGGLPAVWTGPTGLHDKQAFGLTHPTLKPLWLMRTLVDLFAAPGDHILDPFMGSGTTGVAALERGHPFTGLELDPRYFTEAQARIELTKAQPDMLAGHNVKAKQERLSL